MVMLYIKSLSMSFLPKTDIITDRLQLVYKHVNEAQDLDEADRPIEAYVKYLSCMQSIVHTLLDDALGGESWMLKAKTRKSYFKLLGISLERAADNVNLAYSKKAVMNNTIPDAITPGLTNKGVFPPPESPASINPAHHCILTNKFCRQSVTRKTSYDSFKDKSEASMRNSYLQQLHTTLAKDNINRPPTIKVCMNLELARRMEENKDLSEKRARMLQVQRERLKEEAKAQETYHMSVHHVSLKHRVDSFSRRNRWIVSTQRFFRSSSHESEREKCARELSSGVLRLTGHPICSILNQYQSEIHSVVSPSYQRLHQAGDFPTLTLTCNISLSASYFTFDPSPSPETRDGLTAPLSPNDICSLESDTPGEQAALSGRLSYGNLDCLRKVQSEVTGSTLKKLSEQILSKMDFLEFSLVDSYPDLSQYKVICRESVEEVFLYPLWVPLLSLFRCKNLDRELALARNMINRLNDPPSAFHVPQHLCLWDDVTNSNHIPYSAAINRLRLLTDQSSLSEKVSGLNESSRLIISGIEEYQSQRNLKDTSSSVGTDDLLPIVCFTVLRSCTPQLLSECEIIGSLLPENVLFGETGFCLSTVQTALDYLASQLNRAES